MAYASEIAARRKDGLKPKQFVKRWKREVTIELQKGLAKMTMACEPKPEARLDFFLTGKLEEPD